MSKKQSTLAAFGFTKTITHRGHDTTVDIPKKVPKETFKLTCQYCMQGFKNQQGLSVHVMCKHADTSAGLQLPSSTDEPLCESDTTAEILEPTPTVERRRGSDVRKSITNKLKLKAVAAVENGEKAIEVANRLNVSRGQISKWLKMKDKIVRAVVGENKNMFKVTRPARKYNKLFKALNVKFLDSRSTGHRIDFNWLWSKARVIYREQENNDDAVVKKHVIVNFIKRYHLKLRRTQRTKKQDKEAFREPMMKWHSTLRERLVKTGSSENYHPVYGSFVPAQRYNVDQSPLPFAIDTKKTYEHIEPKNPENRNKKVWVSQPGAGLEKRQCTLQICFRPEGQQPRVSVIFRGQGKRLSAVEKASWHADVDVYFQQNAWADTDFCVQWVNKTLKPVVQGRFVLFVDNLTGQVADKFKEAVADAGGVCWYGLPGATDIWQPVDAGYAELLKVKVRQEHYKWLDSEENVDKWYGVDNFTASERRILITHWVGEAYKTLLDSKYETFRHRMFEKTGCLLTADGSGDHLVTPEGLPNYEVPPPTMIEPTPHYAVSSVPEGEIQVDDDNLLKYIENDDKENDMLVEEGIEDDGNIFHIFDHIFED